MVPLKIRSPLSIKKYTKTKFARSREVIFDTEAHCVSEFLPGEVMGKPNFAAASFERSANFTSEKRDNISDNKPTCYLFFVVITALI